MLYHDSSASPAARAQDLLERMTQEEKVAQLVGMFPSSLFGRQGIDPALMNERISDGLGHISGVALMAVSDVELLVAMVNGIQRYLVEETRLGIPALAHSEALNGLLQAQASNFPTAIALASTWAPELVQEMNDVVRREARTLGIYHALSPVLDIARDARWGRVHETYGEDPYLSSAMGVAFVRGLQGSDLREGVIATAKHFVAYGCSEGGRNIGAVLISDRELYEIYCRPFDAVIEKAKLESVMNSYSEVNGEVPAATRTFLRDLLRDRLGFDGVVVADYGSIAMTHVLHEIAADRAEAGIMGIEAGIDIELPEADCYRDLASEVAGGRLDGATLDQSVLRVLMAKFRVGLFENPYADLDEFEALDRSVGPMVAEKLASRSAVLLKNDGDLLPLSKDLSTIAVVGPHADSVRLLFSNYTAPAIMELFLFRGAPAEDRAVDLEGSRLNLQRITEEPAEGIEEATRKQYPNTLTLLEAIRSSVSATTTIVHSRGCSVNGASADDIPTAVAAARNSDVAIVAIGDKTGLVADATSGEGRDRSTLDLPGRQQELLDAVVRTGTPTVVVLINGRPAPIGSGPDGPQAVLEAWQPGSVGMGHVAKILFGESNPSGKLPITVPRTAGQCPIYYGQKFASSYAANGLERYTDVPTAPAYPFGHGLSYTSFAYRSIEVTPETISPDESVSIAVTVVNTGHNPGEEVVQLYAYAPIRGATRPARELIGFQRVDLEPGEQCIVRFDVSARLFACIGTDGQLAVHPGRVSIHAGASSADTPLSGHFTITGDRVALKRRVEFSSRATVIAG